MGLWPTCICSSTSVFGVVPGIFFCLAPLEIIWVVPEIVSGWTFKYIFMKFIHEFSPLFCFRVSLSCSWSLKVIFLPLTTVAIIMIKVTITMKRRIKMGGYFAAQSGLSPSHHYFDHYDQDDNFTMMGKI